MNYEKWRLRNQIAKKIQSRNQESQNAEDQAHHLELAEKRISEISQMPNDEQKVAATYAVLRENEDLMNSNKEHFAKTSVSFAFSEKGTPESGTTILKVDSDEVESYVFGEKSNTETYKDSTTEEIAKVAQTNTEDYIHLVVAKKLSEVWLEKTEGIQQQQLANPLDFEELKTLAQKPYLEKLVTTASLFAGHFSKSDFIIKITPNEQTIGSIAFAVGIEHVVKQMKFVGNFYYKETKDPQWLNPEFLISHPESPLRLQPNGYPVDQKAWFTQSEEYFVSDIDVQLAEQELENLPNKSA